jgi:tetratricopeptide (TPR) repeat protein
VTGRYLSPDDKQRLCKALLRIPAVADRDKRNLYVAELEADLGYSIGAIRQNDAQHDLYAILGAAETHAGGLRRFIAIIRGFHENNRAVAEADRLLSTLEQEPLLRNTQRASLVQMLHDAPTSNVRSALGRIAPNDDQRLVGDPLGLVRRLEMAPPVDSHPPLLLFVDRLAHDSGPAISKKLHIWIDAVGTGMGMSQDDLRALCRVSAAKLASAAPGPADRSGRTRDQQQDPVDNSTENSTNDASSHGASVPTSQYTRAEQPVTENPSGADIHPIRGDIPIRNQDFTGREALLKELRRALESTNKASVLPRALHGLGGVGKTQLAVEYVYRYGEHYDLIWWIPAEQPTLALNSLSTLCDELGLPRNQDQKQTAETVLRALSISTRKWLLVFDNADDPTDIVPLVPSAGGHVIITSRNQEWASVGQAIEVNVFDRTESVDLVRKRRNTISPEDADRLAEKLGDLPLALDQAATWQAATSMPVSEYLDLFDHHVRELLSEGKPPQYPTTVAAFVTLAVNQLRERSPATAQLLELFAFLGAEPVSVGMLRRGHQARLSEPLGRSMREPILLSRSIRDLRRYGLARVDLNQRIQVHRLVQMVLREELSDELIARSRRNVQNLLASANPAAPDDPDTWDFYAEVGPHVLPSGVIDAEDNAARRVALDYTRYLYVIGDYEGTKRYGEMLVRRWSAATGEGLGEDGELTLIATRHLASGIRSLGDNRTAREYDEKTFDRLRAGADFGPDHEHTLATAQNVAVGLRIAGEYQNAFAVDADNVERHVQVFGDEDPLTLRARSNLAVNYRMTGDFRGALQIDEALVKEWRDTVGEEDSRYLFCVANQALDLYGLGNYAEALDLQERTYPRFREVLGIGHIFVLRANRTVAMSLRKVGRYRDALTRARENYHDYDARFGADHEHTMAATMTYANTLRATGELSQARSLAEGAVARYKRVFGEAHPLRLAAMTNLAIILRAVGDTAEAYRVDREAHEGMVRTLGPRHGYTLCVENNLSNDLYRANKLGEARERSGRTLATSREVRGDMHPYTLACAVNAALDLQATGEEAAGQALLDETIAKLATVFGPDHPETLDAGRFRRAECDIEPPPT